MGKSVQQLDMNFIYVARERFPGFEKLVPEVPAFLRTWEPKRNVMKSLGTVSGTTERLGNFHQKMGTLELLN